jgi:hypothetical protein
VELEDDKKSERKRSEALGWWKPEDHVEEPNEDHVAGKAR